MKHLANDVLRPTPIFTKARYIKLGEGGRWDPECITKNIARFGFGTENEQRFNLCNQGRWDELTKSFLAEGKNKGTATRFTNEVKLFFESDCTLVWITFVGVDFYWGVFNQIRPERHMDGQGVWRPIAGAWRKVDLNGEPLTMDHLSGALTKLAGYRGTSCSVDVSDYVIRRIKGQKTPEVERAIESANQMKKSVAELMTLLIPKDFELLVELVFSTSGWRRLGAVGKTQKTLDLDIILPSTGERAFVQIKSRTTSKELAEYVAKIDEAGPFNRMFFVFHSGAADTTDERVTLIGPERLAELVMDAGLTKWLIEKTT